MWKMLEEERVEIIKCFALQMWKTFSPLDEKRNQDIFQQ